MTVKITYGRPQDMQFDINGSRVTVSMFKIKDKALVQCKNTDKEIEFVVTQFIDENYQIVVPDRVDVEDPDLVSMHFTSRFTGTVLVVAGWAGSIKNVNTSVISSEPLVKGSNKVWVDPHERRPYA